MFKSFKVAGSAASLMLFIPSLLAYGISTAASAQVQSFQAPVVVAPAVATPVEANNSPDSAINSTVDAGEAVAASTLAELVSTHQNDEDLDSEARCLATAIFFESRSESLDGQLAVANVVIARSHSGRFAETLCGVVTQPGQFGFVRGGRLPTVSEDSAQWKTAKAIAQIALDGSWKNPVEGALYFHANYSSANFGRPMVAQIGHHIFYR